MESSPLRASAPPMRRSPSQGPPSAAATQQPHPRDVQHSGAPRPIRISTLGWDIKSIIASSPNFHPVQRVHYSSPNAKVDVAIPHVERDGNPLIIAGWNRHPMWPKALFNLEWLKKNGDQNPSVRNVHNWADFKIPLGDFIQRLRDSTAYASPGEQERLYGKDGECPAEWTSWLTQSGALPGELLFNGSNDFLRLLPEKAKVQTLMCYTGIGDTFTPFHKDLCASTGQNLMCFSEHAGSAFWFMTKTSAAPKVAAYFHQLGKEVDLETHVATIEELKYAPFDVYIAEQQLGDLILVPPRSCHQVVNKGGITIKTSWSRMSLIGLQTALWHELPIYHRVCRQEIYKVKSNIFHALQHYTHLVEGLPERRETNTPLISIENLMQLVSLFDDILASEFSNSRDSMPHVSYSQASHTDDLHCDFCGADIFQSFFECDSCLPASSSGASVDVLLVGDGLILCPLCYVEGRTCMCGGMEPIQCRSFSELLDIRDRAISAIQRIDSDYTNRYGYLSTNPLKLLSGQDANVFEAACKLFQRRLMDSKAMRSCRTRASHQVHAAAAVYCKPCHGSKCYSHYLVSDAIHSVDAIMLTERHDGDAIWHQFHRNSLSQYQELLQRTIEDEQNGIRPNASHRLTYLAKVFTTCRAMAPEVTKHGWYDKFAQITSIPIVNSPSKALIGSLDETQSDEQPPGHAADDSSSSKITINGITNSHHKSSSPGVSDEARLPQPNLSVVITDSRPPEINLGASSELTTLQALYSPKDANIRKQQDGSSFPLHSYTPVRTEQPPAAALLFEDSTDNLSDLTDLPAEINSSPRILDNVPSALKMSGKRHTKRPSLTPSSAQGPPTSSKSKPKLVFDCVEIRPFKGHVSRTLSNSRQSQKRTTTFSPSDTTGPSESDEDEYQPSSSGKRIKITHGPASRLLRSSKRILSSVNITPQNDILANALNQTFQLNTTRDSTTPISLDKPPSISDVAAATKPQYREIGVQKNLNFTRLESHAQPFEDLTSCINGLREENHELRSQAETYKCQRDMYRENLDEIKKRYNTSGTPPPPRAPPPVIPPPPPPPPTTPPPLPPPRVPPSLSSRPRPEHTTPRPRWRPIRAATPDDQTRSMDISEIEHPPIEAFRSPPSSPETDSMSPRRFVPTEPRSHRRLRGSNDLQGSRTQPNYYFGPHGRRRETYGRGRRGRGRGRASYGRGEAPNGNLSPPNSPGGAGARRTSWKDVDDEAMAQDHRQALDDGF